LGLDSDKIDILLRRLQLSQSASTWREVVEQAEEEKWSHATFLLTLLANEVRYRQAFLDQAEVRNALFPFVRTLDDFDFSDEPELSPEALGPFGDTSFVRKGRSLVLTGGSGRGKTHLSVAIAYAAIKKGHSARFIMADQLLTELGKAAKKGELQRGIDPYVAPDVLIIDDMGRRRYRPDESNLLFSLLSRRRNLGRPVILTIEQNESDGIVAVRGDIVEMVMDSVLRNGRHLHLAGSSYRNLDVDGFGKTTVPTPDLVAEVTGDYENSMSEGTSDSEVEASTSKEPEVARRVLICEDDMVAREIIEYHFKQRGWEVCMTEDGNQASRTLEREVIDAALLDLGSQFRNGIELLLEIRAREKSTATRMPVILLSARKLEDDEVAGFSAGADDFVVKPFSPQALALRLERLFKRA
jgi:DNA replication protein DnaC/ActR/RegA family two-component response regulator